VNESKIETNSKKESNSDLEKTQNEKEKMELDRIEREK